MRPVIFAMIVFLSACSTEEPDKPEGVLNADQFTALMIDVQLVEGIRAQRIEVSDKKGKAESFLYAEVFDKHGVSRYEFEITYAYYMKNPKRMEVIYEQVLDSLNKLDADIKQAFSEELKMKADSTQKATDKMRDSLKGYREQK